MYIVVESYQKRALCKKCKLLFQSVLPDLELTKKGWRFNGVTPF